MTLADLRRNVALSQVELAQVCGVTQATVSAWERGITTPHPRHVRALATALGVTPKDVQDAIQSINRSDDRE